MILIGFLVNSKQPSSLLCKYPRSTLALLLQVAEEEYLIQELRKIESRKKEREKKAQDLQKLITAADSTTEMRRGDRKATKKKPPQKREAEKPVMSPRGRDTTHVWSRVVMINIYTHVI